MPFGKLKKIAAVYMLIMSMPVRYCYAANLTCPKRAVLLASAAGRQLMKGTRGGKFRRLLQHLTTQQLCGFLVVKGSS